VTERSSESAYLLDTHAALWALERPEKLGTAARKAASSGPNVLSVVTYWEVMLKSRKGKLDVGDPRMWWHEALEQLAATVLPLRPEHVAAVYRLAPIHKDPFDRMLIAQATVEGLALVSADAEVRRYASKSLRIVK
jgi:PIN domain nuclease of toxin-antitoxin system